MHPSSNVEPSISGMVGGWFLSRENEKKRGERGGGDLMGNVVSVRGSTDFADHFLDDICGDEGELVVDVSGSMS